MKHWTIEEDRKGTVEVHRLDSRGTKLIAKVFQADGFGPDEQIFVANELVLSLESHMGGTAHTKPL